MKTRNFHILIVVLAVSSLMSSCSYWNRLGMGGKVAILSIASAGGAFGAPAGLGGVAGGLLAGGAVATAPVLSTQQASTAQKSTALRVARMAQSKMDPELRKKLLASERPYISVRTHRGSSQVGSSQVMVYDIKRDTLASPDVFDIKVDPKEGDFVKFDTFFTQYVGDGDVPVEKKPEPKPEPEVQEVKPDADE